MNFTRRLSKLEAVITPSEPRCRVCGYKLQPDRQRAGAMVIYADGSFWDTTPRCECGHILTATGEPYPSESGPPGSGLLLINVSHYSLCVGGDGELKPIRPFALPRRLPPEWWLPGKPPSADDRPKLCPIDARMIALALEHERAAEAGCP